jgi:cellulose synthase/poly-beta-1,6-N-acetylglucosamine synthase-like glycosyltransferase
VPADRISQEYDFQRPAVRGKFLYCGDRKLWVRGISYGTFQPDHHGREFHDADRVERDFARMSASGINAVRTYTVPPRWLLNLACKYRLHVMAGLPWEQHVAFLDDKRRSREIRQRVREAVRLCAGHPAVLCYAIGNEIPAPIARWHGAQRIEQYLQRLYAEAKEADPEALFTYVNYPSTEYLELDFVDLVAFNVYLETQQSLEAYIARLHNIAGNRPLLLGELGLDSLRNGEEAQSRVLDWQVRTAFAEGCAGAFVFSWTDEWYRGGHQITDWAFGLTDRERRAKPALAAVGRAFGEVPFAAGRPWPAISVVVCSFNGARTIRECLEGLMKLDYPNYEVIVVDDGSTDDTAEIARQYPFRLIRTENRGLSSARNTGFEAATGEIVAYIDDDAYPDPHWLTYLANTFMTTNHAGAGGPNLPPPGDGRIADCVAVAPGGPIHVLTSDREAEHIPGCNMAFRKAALEAVGGFDTTFRVAGDDVDICWRLQQRGWTLGFNPAAVVWHHRRNSIRTYLRQQWGYGKAEALLEEKWPEKYNTPGHLVWAGRIYSPSLSAPRRLRRIFHGVWGSALFQSVYQPAPGYIGSLPLMPEWYLLIGGLAAISAAVISWKPLWAVLLLAAIGFSAIRAAASTLRVSFPTRHESRAVRLGLRGLTALLYLLQPLARLRGRLRHGLSPWRRRRVEGWTWPRLHIRTIWSQHWRAPEDWLRLLEADLRATGARVVRGGDYDRWDLEVARGTFGSVRLMTVIEEHGAGKQLARMRVVPRCSRWTLPAIAMLVVPALAMAWDGAWIASGVLGILAVQFTLRTAGDLGAATAVALRVLKAAKAKVEEPLVEPEAETAIAAPVQAATRPVARAGGRWA